MRVAVLDDYHGAFVDSPPLERLAQRPDVEEVRVVREPLPSPEALAARVGDCEALIAIRERTRFVEEVFDRLPALRLIAQTGNHVYHIDMAAAARHRVAVAMDRSPSGGTTGAAELTIGLALALLRHIPYYDAAVRRGQWEVPYGITLGGKTIGVIGLGKVGGAVARIAHGLGMHVVAWSRHLTPSDAEGHGAACMDLDELLRVADVVSVHLTLSPESRGLLDTRRIGLMRPSAVLINTARGPIVDESALVAALTEGRIAGAGLDVFDREPLPADHPLCRLPNVVLTPHAGWPTDTGYQTFARAAAEMIGRFLDGHHEQVINPEVVPAQGD